ncbi:MAG: chemotaxis protein CheB [Alcanivoracaceae bacterium]|uniref:chemotaxis protein CheB n=1 Tax=Alcanivorax sp. MD8A TaxID=1177157 RepID=UPI000C58B12C|nr:chemotaxis protein CheB [Alcanivorax sp. MD8A]MAX56036.1 chemotaxis protein CheB [Alcanivoracaceae bacterium]MCG8436911.1 chemotaxis protein CheB [Pseudomonadales bacterium]MED5432563.1 chemotaxis protein CheB [Pseudomonadota bacterium]MEE2869113.1 chemotaxis protein CheB [Pseudomonadota bacterium]PNE03900.1 protein-glutamate methylesterase [Alcanivorax sp. MD8A]|tara:strand:+ start:8688 stop:9701 length:1014 start_codon:yes stop_codon:yes gene_type:complete
MTAPGRVGVIADDTLQGHLLSSAVKSQGYQVVVSTEPDALEDRWLSEDALDLWVVDLSSEDRWQAFLDTLLERADAPILFCDGQAPARTDARYPKWERRLVTKLVSFIGKPAVEERLDVIPAKPPRQQIPAPREFQAIAPADRPQRVWVLGASLGGPAAVKVFLDCLPDNLPVAFVLAQHIDGSFLDTLCGVLGRDNKIHCKVGRDGEALRHGELAIAPVEYAVQFRHDGRIQSTHQPWEGPYAPSIDQVIQHVGEGFGQASGAILFSGMGNDGAIAAPRLSAMGCPVWAQSADTCAVSSQPDSVRETGCVSFSGSPEQLALQLVERVRKELNVQAG